MASLRQLPAPEAIPVGEATEIPMSKAGPKKVGIRAGSIPVGAASEMPMPNMGPQPAAPSIPVGQATEISRAEALGQRAGSAVRNTLDNPTLRTAATGLSKGLSAIGAVYSADQAIDANNRGDNLSAAVHGLDAAAAVGATNPATLPYSTVYGVGRAAGEMLPEGFREKIGSAVNSGLRLFGGGVDDSAIRDLSKNGAGGIGGNGLVGPPYASGNGLPNSTPQPTIPPGSDPRGLMRQFDAPSALPPVTRAGVAPGVSRNGNSYSQDPNAVTPTGYSDNVMQSFRPTGYSDNATQSFRPTPAVAQAQSAAPDPTLNQAAGGIRWNGSLFSDQSKVNSLRFNLENMISNPRSFRGTGAQYSAAIGALQNQISALSGRDEFGRTELVENAETGRANMRDRGETSRFNAGQENETARSTMRDNVTMRGQDLTLQGQTMQARATQQSARIKQMNDDRQFQLDLVKEGRAQAEAAFNRRTTAQKEFNEYAQGQFVGPDGKPDAQKASVFVASVDHTMGNMITRMRQNGQNEQAEKLSKEGFAGLDAQDRANMRMLFERKSRVEESLRRVGDIAGADGVASMDLYDFQITGLKRGWLNERYELAGGQTIDTDDFDKKEGLANRVLYDWGKSNSNYLTPSLIEQQRLRAQGAQ